MTATADFHLTVILLDNTLVPPAPAYVSVTTQQIGSGAVTPDVTVARNAQFSLDTLDDAITNTINATLDNTGNPRYATIPGQSATLLALLATAPGTVAKKDFFANARGKVDLLGFLVDNVIGIDSGGARPATPATKGSPASTGNPAIGVGATAVYAQKFFK